MTHTFDSGGFFTVLVSLAHGAAHKPEKNDSLNRSLFLGKENLGKKL